MERGFDPTIVANERPKETTDWRERATARLGEFVRERFDAWKSPLPAEAWLRRGLILSAFLLPGARIDDPEAPWTITSPSAERAADGLIPESARQALLAYATQETHLDPGIQSIGSFEDLPDGSHSWSRTIAAQDLETGHPFAFKNGVYRLVMRRDVPLTTVVGGEGWKRSKMSDNGQDITVATRTLQDAYGNGIEAVRVFSPDGLTAHETVTVLPDIPLDTDGTPDMVPLRIELGPVGGGDFSGAFLVKEASRQVRTEHFSMYGYETISPEVVDLIAAEDGAIKRGLDNVAKLFGRPSTDIISLFLDKNIGENAGVLTSQPNVVHFEVALLANAHTRPEGFVELIAQHEGFHAADAELSFANSALMQAAYLLMPKEDYSLMDESAVYPYAFGGHSAANTAEFYASFMDSFVRPDWEKWIILQPKELREPYLLAAQGLEASLRAQTTIPEDAPIRALTEERIRFLTVLQ